LDVDVLIGVDIDLLPVLRSEAKGSDGLAAKKAALITFPIELHPKEHVLSAPQLSAKLIEISELIFALDDDGSHFGLKKTPQIDFRFGGPGGDEVLGTKARALCLLELSQRGHVRAEAITLQYSQDL